LPENVAVVINDASPVSQRVGEYYTRTRAIPASNVFHIRTSVDETIDLSTYATTIEGPIAAALSREGLQDRVLYIVLTKGTPLRIRGTDGQDGTAASVDSELTLLYRKMLRVPVPQRGRIDNPYFLGARALADGRRFTHRDLDIYLVTRLDAFTEAEVIGLIDRGAAPTADGKIVLDEQDKLVDRAGEQWLEEAAARLTSGGQGARVVLEKTVQGARDVSPVIGYYSWGSNDPRNRVRSFGMGFVPGSLAATYVSTDARTFAEPPADWVPSGDWNDRRGFFAGSPQTLVGDLIREGATGVAGHVGEPYLQSTIRPEILFPTYLAGFNLVESFYLAMPHLSWQTVVVGDPLCAPFSRGALTRAEIDDGVDEVTLLPRYFSKKRLELVAAQLPDVPAPALALGIRGETLAGRADMAGARAAYEEATQLAPGFAGGHFQLAMLYELEQNREAAAERYEKVIALQPRNAVALNNLAYIMAVYQKRPAEALPLARRALAAAPQSAVILDTLAWVQHLLGDNANALKMLAAAAKGAPNNADVRLHTAIVTAATGARAAAEFELAEALRLKPELENSDEVKQLRLQLEKLAAP
jgi:uncharacterized protein (TIGR03790 family)